MPVVLRVVTYNIQHGANAVGTLDIGSIARVLASLEADVICLQEVDVHWSDRSRFLDEAGELAGALDVEHHFAPIYSLSPSETGGPRREFGLAVLSRHPITAARNHPLSRISSLEQEKGIQVLPGFQDVTLDVQGRAVRVFNTQLSWLDAALRVRETEEMLAIAGEPTAPTLLAGDLNGLPDAVEVRLLHRHFNDAFAATRSDDHGFTFPAQRPTKRIDYIFASSAFAVEACRVVDTLASDHRPVLACLALEDCSKAAERTSGA